MDTTVTITLNKEEDSYSKEALVSDILVGSVMEVFDYKAEDMKAVLYRKNGQLFSGKLIIKYSSGDTFFDCTYKDGKQDGVETRYYPNNIIAKKTQIKCNKGEGDIYIYDIYGRLSIFYQQKNDLPNGVIEYYYPNGNVKEKGKQYTNPSDGLFSLPKREGVWKYYYENGQIKRRRRMA